MATRNILPDYNPTRQTMLSDGSIVDPSGKVIYSPPAQRLSPLQNFKAQVGKAAQRQAEVANTRVPTPSNPLQRARDAANDPKLQLQQDRLKLQQQRLSDEQKRYADKQRTSKEKAKSKPASSGRGGGGRGGMSPEQKAREKAREARQTARELKRDRRAMDRYNNNTELRAGRDAKTAGQYYAIRDSDRPTAGEQQAIDELAMRADSGPFLNPYSDGPREFPTAEAKEAYLRERLAKEKHIMDSAAQEQKQREHKMVQAYGNKYAKVWVKARGDL